MRPGLSDELEWLEFCFMSGYYEARYENLRNWIHNDELNNFIRHLWGEANYNLMLDMMMKYPDATDKELGQMTMRYVFYESPEEERKIYWENDSKIIIKERKKDKIQAYQELFYKATGKNIRITEKDT